jgi:signal peptidase I
MQRFVVHENSMQPALEPGDCVLAARRPPRVRQIVVFRDPSAGAHFYIKRVAAIGGARVTIDGPTLIVDGADHRRELSLPHPERSRSWTLLDDEVFVLSDNLAATRADSRVFGPIGVDGVQTVVLRYAPLRRMGVLL